MKRILISNGRSPITLDFIRNLSHAGHEVYVSETSNLHLSRFSNCVKKCFLVPSPRFAPLEHVKKMVEIVKNEGIDFVVPAWEDALLIAKHQNKFPKTCTVFTSKYPLLYKLHNKSLFINLLESENIKIPKTVLIESLDDLDKIEFPQYALKACYSRASQSVYKINQGDPYPEIEPSSDQPWVAQEWLEGKSFCTFSICHKGRVHAHSTYPVDFTLQKKGRINSTVGSYCMTFKAVEHEAILSWVQNLIKNIRYTGLIAFDFIELPSGELYAIECNPRITSGITLFSHDSKIDEALFGTNSALISADLAIEKQITPGMLLYGWRSALTCKKLPLFFSRLFHFKDLVFQKSDPLPFFAQAFLWLKHSYDIMRFNKRLHGAFTHDLDFEG